MAEQNEEQPFAEFDGKVYVRHDVYQRECDKVREKDAQLERLQATVDRMGKKLTACRNRGFALRVQQGVGSSFNRLITEAVVAAGEAMVRFPQPNYVLTKFAEEAGEVVKGCVHMAEGRTTPEATPEAVRGEMVQTIAMMYRLWAEGDRVHGLPAVGAVYLERNQNVEQ